MKASLSDLADKSLAGGAQPCAGVRGSKEKPIVLKIEEPISDILRHDAKVIN
jgi:hypothetical protein